MQQHRFTLMTQAIFNVFNDRDGQQKQAVDQPGSIKTCCLNHLFEQRPGQRSFLAHEHALFRRQRKSRLRVHLQTAVVHSSALVSCSDSCGTCVSPRSFSQANAGNKKTRVSSDKS